MSQPPPNAPSAAEVKERLEAFRARRGYVLPHQGAMAAALPALQDVYPLFYKTLTLDLHHLSEFEREFVWLALLTAADEAIGTHHIHLFFQTGGTDRLAEAAFRLVAWSRGVETYQFLEKHWQPYFPVLRAHGIRRLHHGAPEGAVRQYRHPARQQHDLADRA